MFITQSGKGLGTRSKITRESGTKTRTSTALSTAHDLNPRQRRTLFATPSSSLEDLELHVIFQVYEEKESLQNDNKQFVFEDNLPPQSGN